MQASRLFSFFTFVLFLLLLPMAGQASAQQLPFIESGSRTVHAYTDVYKTDFERPFRKLQAGVEAGYMLMPKLMITGGLEFWNREPTPLLSLGNRYYPYGATFVRYRALIGRNADAGLGLGYSLRLGKHWLLEAATDYYLDQREIGFRLGLGYIRLNQEN